MMIDEASRQYEGPKCSDWLELSQKRVQKWIKEEKTTRQDKA
jgi:hypothetical protein